MEPVLDQANVVGGVKSTLEMLASTNGLFLIDPNSDSEIEHLCTVLSVFGYDMDFYDLRNILISYTKKIYLSEPKGLGAVVEDHRGVKWVRVEGAKGMENPWQDTLNVKSQDSVRNLSWSSLGRVKILHEGFVDE